MHIVLVDDEPIVHRTWQRVVRGLPVRLSFAATCDEARSLLARERRSVDAVILDLRLDGGSGLDLVPFVRLACPSAPVVLLSAYLEAETMIKAQELGLTVVAKDRCIRKLRLLLPLLARRDDYAVRTLFPGLSSREIETVEQTVIHDNNSQEAAKALGIRESTFRGNWSRIVRKTGLTRWKILCAITQNLASRAQGHDWSHA